MIRGVEVTGTKELATAEFGASPDTIAVIKSGQIATTLKAISEGDKVQLKAQIENVRISVAQAADILRTKRGRFRVLNQFLSGELAAVGDVQDNFKKFYFLAGPAIAGSQTAATAAQVIKSAIDTVNSGEKEIKYRQFILAELGSNIEIELQELQVALNVLDEMVVAIT